MSLVTLATVGYVETGDAPSAVHPVASSTPLAVDRGAGALLSLTILRPGGAPWSPPAAAGTPPVSTSATLAIWRRTSAQPAVLASISGAYTSRGVWEFELSATALRSVPLGTHLYDIGVETPSGERAVVAGPAYFRVTAGGAFGGRA